jgi:hypothetical protein
MPAIRLTGSISPFPLPVPLLHCNGRLRNLRIFYIFYEMRQTLLNSVFVNFCLPFQPSVPFIQCSEVFVYYNLLQELMFVIKQIEIEGLWLKIMPGVDVQRTVSSNGLARSPWLLTLEKPVPVLFLRSPLPDFCEPQKVLRKIKKLKFSLIKARSKQE